MKLAIVAIAIMFALVSAAAAQTTAVPGFVSAGRGAPVTPKLPYPQTDVASLADELAAYPVVGPFRLAVRGKPQVGPLLLVAPVDFGRRLSSESVRSP